MIVFTYQSVDHLKQALRREWVKIPQSNIRAACDGFIGRLKAIIRAKVTNSNKSKLILKFDAVSDIFCYHSIKFKKKNYGVWLCCNCIFLSHPVYRFRGMSQNIEVTQWYNDIKIRESEIFENNEINSFQLLKFVEFYIFNI